MVKNKISAGILIAFSCLGLFLIQPYFLYTALFTVASFELITRLSSSKKGHKKIILITSILYLLFALYCFARITQYSYEHALYLGICAVFSDTFAYALGKSCSYVHENNMFVGFRTIPTSNYVTVSRNFNLCEFLASNPTSISPNKTVGGFVGSFISGCFTWGFCYMTFVKTNLAMHGILTSCMLALIGQMGDLIESALKRHLKIKDMSCMLGSHGGFCDRIDSAVAIVIASFFILKMGGKI